MQTTTKKLLDELYDLEPLLKERESEITEIIETMLTKRPIIKIDESWKKKVKEEILSTFTQKEREKVWNIRFWSWFFPLTTTVFALLFFSTLVPSLFHWERGGMNSPGLMTVERKESKQWQQDATITPMMTISRTMMAPSEGVQYHYVYTGSLDIVPRKLPVYEKKSSSFDTNELETYILWSSLEELDIHALKNAHITTLTLVEDRPFGYMLTIDFLWGNISLYQNYEKWPQPKCNQDWCEAQKALTLTDISNEKKILSISDVFLEKYGIKGMKYGSGFIDYSWKNQNENMIPEILTILYPVLLDDMMIYEENGIPRWITLTYDVRNGIISGLSGLEKSSVQRIESPIISDTRELQTMISQGGQYVEYREETWDRKIIDITLGTPTIAYMHISRTSSSGSLREYYIPSLVFRVIDIPKDTNISDTIIIPLVSEFLENEWVE